MSKLYELAIIACTATKNPMGKTAMTLYRGGPFSLNVRHAQMRADKLLIMSAKYGLLRPDDPVEYYDLYLPDLFGFEREELVELVSQQGKALELLKVGRAISYLPLAYFALLEEALPAFAERMDRPFKGVGMMRAWKIMSEELAQVQTNRQGLLDD